MMIILLAIILIIYFINLTIKKAKISINTSKHSIIRICVLVVAIPLIILGCNLLDDSNNSMLGALFLTYGFFGVWLLYLLAETISLFVVKQNELAKTSLLIFIFSAIIVGIGTTAYFSSLH